MQEGGEMRKSLNCFLPLAAALLLAGSAAAATPGAAGVLAGLDAAYPSMDALYRDIHAHPELSGQEVQTAGKLAAALRVLGFTVTEHVGGFGVVGVLRNGPGPTVMVRTELDALPVREQTGLPYASTVTARNDAGETVPVMHACGHDVHMASWLGAATLLANSRAAWHGTLVFIGQPAEEGVAGAERMIKDGLMTRFPKPDYVLAIHDTNLLPAGQVDAIAGPASAASSSVDITFHGRGGHGALPHLAVDPLLIASRFVVTLQSVIAREVNPLDPAVITVGTFHAGTRRNVIADDATVQLTVRSYKPEVQEHLLAAIARIAKGEAAAGNAPREPTVTVLPDRSEVVYNDPAMAARLKAALLKGLGAGSVQSIEPTTASEDFGVFGRVAGAPSVQLRLGAVEPKTFDALKAKGQLAPGVHTAQFSPDREPTLRTGAKALTLSVLELLDGKAR
jgi:hippurate hydrolase